jgi:hypothetical protein
MDSTEIPVFGEQEQSACNTHDASTCDRPPLLFNSGNDRVAAKLQQATFTVQKIGSNFCCRRSSDCTSRARRSGAFSAIPSCDRTWLLTILIKT